MTFAVLLMKHIYDIWVKHKNISTDTRNIQHGDIFFALKGKHFDGNTYAQEAIKKGASYAIVDDKKFINTTENIIVVDDVLKALQQCALRYRNTFHIPFIALTGSNGKTTTKELIHSILSKKYKTHTTAGNFNNHIGIPLTLLATPEHTEIAIIEMGANHVGEIASYCEYTLPNYGFITNIGKAHIGEFGSFEHIIRGKTELYHFLSKNEATLFYNSDDTLLNKEVNKQPYQNATLVNIKDLFTLHSFTNTDTGLCTEISYLGKKYTIPSNLYGDYNLGNILFAIALGLYFKVDIYDIMEGITSYHPINQRSQKIDHEDNTYIFDSYNANPSSMELAIKSFHKKNYDSPIYILGSMKELGEYSQKEHQEMIDLLSDLNITKHVILIGKEFENCNHPYHYFPNIASAQSCIESLITKGHHILLKGSRESKIENLFKHILKHGS